MDWEHHPLRVGAADASEQQEAWVEIERLQKEVRRWQLRQRIGWYDPDTKRFCYSDVKDAYSASHASYLIPVFIEAAKAAEGE